MKEMWDARYSNDEYAYGISPNEFFKDTIDSYKLTGKILLPAEGEGRNAVYAAKNGLDVHAFDISIEGMKKALKLASKENAVINYEVGDFFELNSVNHNYEAAGLIYAHFPSHLLDIYYKKVANLLKPNGIIILEGFSTNHLKYQDKNPGIGGPNKLDMLFSIESILEIFPNFDVIQLEEVEVTLKEGLYHNGVGSVIRFIGRKLA